MRALIAALGLTVVACATPVRSTLSPGQLGRAIIRAESTRNARDPALMLGLGRSQPELRVAALRSLARIEDVRTATQAAVLLGDRDPTVAKWAAFAVGQIGGPLAEAALTGALIHDLTPVPEEALLALGRTGTPTAAATVARFLEHSRLEVRSAAAVGLALLGRRYPDVLLDTQDVTRLVSMTRVSDPSLRWAAAYTLAQSNAPGISAALTRLLSDPQAEVRMWAVRGLGELDAAPAVMDPVLRDQDWRVQMEVAAALASVSGKEAGEVREAVSRLSVMAERAATRLVGGPPVESGRGLHVLSAVVTAAERLGGAGRSVLQTIDRALSARSSPPSEGLHPVVALDRARVECAVARTRDRLVGVVDRVLRCGKDQVSQEMRLRWVAALHSERGDDAAVDALFTLAQAPEAQVRLAAVEGLARIKGARAGDRLVLLLDSDDSAVVSASAAALASTDRELGAVRLPVVFDHVLARLQRRNASPSFIVGVLDGLGRLRRDRKQAWKVLERFSIDIRPAVRRRARLAHAALIEAPRPSPGAGAPKARYPAGPPRAVLAIDTHRGRIRLELDGTSAPRTAGAFLGLVTEAFYDGLTWHRVVPGFVAQGGCPRGDGYGGPGYALLDETSPLPFSRGAVGIATNGRDTGGSQFFIMQAEHPHLVGGYTRVGRVTEGIDVVDALQEGDRILRIRVLDPRPQVGRGPRAPHTPKCGGCTDLRRKA